MRRLNRSALVFSVPESTLSLSRAMRRLPSAMALHLRLLPWSGVPETYGSESIEVALTHTRSWVARTAHGDCPVGALDRTPTISKVG